ncbi:MAG TPA: hypothetical protein VHM90_04655, partial [Phycisphaerae bacterium]|nr:hypothetical protein [Phycisphaerae bacterium]
HAAAPSSGTLDTLVRAYEFRVFKQLRKISPEFEKFAATYYRAVGLTRSLAYLVHENGPLGKQIAAHPDFQKALALIRQDEADFPTSASGIEWAIFSVLDPPTAQKLAANFRNVARHVLTQSVSNLTSPASASEALDAAWIALALGKPDEARAAIAKTAAFGVPLPPVK